MVPTLAYVLLEDGLETEVRWSRISKTPKTQKLTQVMESNARLIDGDGRNTSFDEKHLRPRLSQF